MSEPPPEPTPFQKALVAFAVEAMNAECSAEDVATAAQRRAEQSQKENNHGSQKGQ